MPKMKTKSGAKKTLQGACRWQYQALTGVQAPYLDQEDHQEQASVAWYYRSSRKQHGVYSRHDALRLRSKKCQELNVV